MRSSLMAALSDHKLLIIKQLKNNSKKVLEIRMKLYMPQNQRAGSRIKNLNQPMT